MWTSIRFTLLIFVLSGLLYPLAMTGLAQVLFPAQANGSLLKNHNGQVIGSALIGQAFSKAAYFHPRPSVNSYDAANSGGYNQGTANQKLVERVQKDAMAYRQQNPGIRRIPIDAVTASGSGLDPHITLSNAMAQVPRVAQAHHLDANSVKRIVMNNTEHSPLGDGPYINVLQVNLALDRQR